MAIVLRPDFDVKWLRAAAHTCKSRGQTRRLTALGAVHEDATRTKAARIGCMILQIVRNRALKLNEHGPESLIERKAPDQATLLDDAHRAAPRAMIESGPIPAVHRVVRWRIIDPCQWSWENFRVNVARQTLGRELHAVG